jgi:hypothetical protein
MVASGRQDLIKAAIDFQSSMASKMDMSNTLVRILMGASYLPPTSFLFNFARRLTENGNDRVRRAAILALGSMVRQSMVFWRKLSRDAQRKTLLQYDFHMFKFRYHFYIFARCFGVFGN